MSVKFVVMLTRVANKDVDAPLRALFAELKGCRVLAVIQRGARITVTMVGEDWRELHTEKTLFADMSSLTNRVPSMVRLDEVRLFPASGALEKVTKILEGRKAKS